MKMNQKICDYSGYDYKNAFWVNQNRDYEHALETSIIHHLLIKYFKDKKDLLDAGCGFGRLFNTYNGLFTSYHLVDYAEHLLKEAKDNISDHAAVTFYQQSLYNLTLKHPIDSILSIRTLHHLNDLDTLFHQFNSVLSLNGRIILDIPNQYHIKNRIKHLFKPQPSSFTKRSECYYNYDPKYVFKKLKKYGFKILDYRQVGLFRTPIIKRIIPKEILVYIESLMNYFIKTFNIGPSVYIVAEKTVDNFVDN